MAIFAGRMARECTDIDDVLRQINSRLRKLEKSDSEKNEEIGRLNRIIGKKDVEIHSLKVELAEAKSRIKEQEDELDKYRGEGSGTHGSPGKPEKNTCFPQRGDPNRGSGHQADRTQ